MTGRRTRGIFSKLKKLSKLLKEVDTKLNYLSNVEVIDKLDMLRLKKKVEKALDLRAEIEEKIRILLTEERT